MFVLGIIILYTVTYRSACGCVYMYDTVDIGPRSIDGRVEVEAGLVDPEISAAPVHHLTLTVYLHLESRAHNNGLIKAIGLMNVIRTTGSSFLSSTDLFQHILIT